jgi:hypothetical protein
MKTQLVRLIFLFTLILVLIACRKTDRGILVGVKAHFSLNDLQSGLTEKNVYYDGAIVIKKSNGKEIEAICDTSLAKKLKGGQTLKVVYDEKMAKWKVISIIKE